MPEQANYNPSMMTRSDTVSRLIAGAYSASIDDACWSSWAEQAIIALGGIGGSFTVLDPQSRAIHRMINIHVDQKVQDEYFAEELWRLDPQISHACGLKRSTLYLDTDHIDLSDPGTVEHVSFLRSKSDWGHHMTGVARLGGGQSLACLSIHRSVADGATPLEQQRTLATLLPELICAMELGFRHAEKLNVAWWDGYAASMPNEAAALLGFDGRLIRMTVPFARTISLCDGLDAPGLRLSAAYPADHKMLCAALAGALSRNSATASMIRVTRPSGMPSLILRVFPYGEPSRILVPHEAAALVSLVDPAKAVTPDHTLLRQCFGLTVREAEIAADLSSGQSPEEIAIARNLKIATVRTHVRHLLEKSGSRRISSGHLEK